MSDELTVKKSIHINAPVQKVWQALTDPRLTEIYFFGCRAISDWRVGSDLVWKATVDGKETIPVKGKITAIEENVALTYTCFAPEHEGNPAKHTAVTYRMTADGDATQLSLTQGVFDDAAECAKTNGSWDLVLGGLKKLLEGE